MMDRWMPKHTHTPIAWNDRAAIRAEIAEQIREQRGRDFYKRNWCVPPDTGTIVQAYMPIRYADGEVRMMLKHTVLDEVTDEVLAELERTVADSFCECARRENARC